MKSKFHFGIWGIVFLTGIFFSCGSEDETPTAQPLVGTWNYSSYEYDATINGQDYIPYLAQILEVSELQAKLLANVYILQEIDPQMEGLSVRFDPDGTYALRRGGSEETGTYSLNSDNTHLTLVSETETTVIDVLELGASNLELGLAEALEQDFDGDGQAEMVEVDLLLSLIK